MKHTVKLALCFVGFFASLALEIIFSGNPAAMLFWLIVSMCFAAPVYDAAYEHNRFRMNQRGRGLEGRGFRW